MSLWPFCSVAVLSCGCFVTVAVLSMWPFCHVAVLYLAVLSCGRFVTWPFCHVAVLNVAVLYPLRKTNSRIFGKLISGVPFVLNAVPN